MSLNKAEKLNREVLELVKDFNYASNIYHFVRQAVRGFEWFQEYLNKDEFACWVWLHCLTKLKQPKQFVELGAAFGNSTISIATAMPKDSRLISVDIGGIQPTWGNLDQYYPSLLPIWGNDLDLKIYPKNIDLKKTDIWYIDSEHTAEHFQKELDLYSPFFKKGAIVACDDIHFNDMFSTWEKIPYEKCDNSFPCHTKTGFGVFVV